VIRYIPREENSIADALTRVLNAPDGPFALTKSTSGKWVVPCFLKKKSRGSGDLDLCIEKTEEAIQKVDDLLAELQDRLSQAVAKKKTLEEELVQLNASQEILNRTLGRSNIISIKKAS
jgi:hypothetical protein